MKYTSIMSSVLLASFLTTTSNVQAIDLNVMASAKMSVEAGLDPATRELIEKLPAEIRAQVLGLLQDALPLIDKSVDLYLTRVDQILNSQIDHIGCQLTGSGKTIIDEVAAKFGGPPSPVSSLKKQSDDLKTAFKTTSTPDQYRLKYADFLVNGNTTACSVAAVPEAYIVVSQLRADGSARARVWNRLYGLQCADADECFTEVFKTTSELVAKADTRDSTSIAAADKLNKVTRPKKTSLFASFRQDIYEEQFFQLFSIQDGLLIAMTARQSVAKQYLSAASTNVGEAEKAVNSAEASLSPSMKGMNDAANAAVAGIAKLNAEVPELLASATTYDATLASAAQSIASRLDAVKTHGEKVVAKANENNVHIQQIEYANAEAKRLKNLCHFCN